MRKSKFYVANNIVIKFYDYAHNSDFVPINFQLEQFEWSERVKLSLFNDYHE